MIKNINTIITKLQTKYAFLKLTEEDFYKIIDNNMSEFRTLKNDCDIQEIESLLEDNIKSIVNFRLCENADALINDYINSNIVVSNDLNVNISSLINFISFFEQFDYELQIFNVITLNSRMFELLTSINNNVDFNLEELEENIACWIQIYNTIINSEEVLVEEEYFSSYKGPVDDSVKIYLLEMAKYPLLNFEQEKELGYKIMNGDKEAKEELANSNLRLVVSVAKRNVNKGLPFLDLIQEGNLGLIKAVDNYNPSLGFKFSTFATCWIRQYVSRAIYNQSKNIRVPVYLYAKINKYRNVKRDFIDDNGYEPSTSQIAEIMNLSVSEVNKIISLQFDTVSLNRILKDEDRNRTELGDIMISPGDLLEDSVIQKHIYSDVVGLLDECGLKDREKKILSLYFGLYGTESKTLEEIGEIYGITKSRVGQIKEDALVKIRNAKQVRKNLQLYVDDDLVSLEDLSYKKNLSDKPLNTIYENYKAYSKEQIHIMLSCLKDKHKKLVVDRYGDDFDTPVIVSMLKREDAKKFYGYLNRKMVHKLGLLNTISCNSVNISDTDLIAELCLDKILTSISVDELLNILRKITFYKMSDIYSNKANAILALKLGYIDGKYFSNLDISEFFDIKESLVPEILFMALDTYCDVAEEFINCNDDQFSDKVKSLVLKDNI